MEAYLSILQDILKRGKWKKTRTGTDALTIAGAFFSHEMADGFPLLTTKEVAFKPIRHENDMFIHGITNKEWLQDRGVEIWSEWANPEVLRQRYTFKPENAEQEINMAFEEFEKAYFDRQRGIPPKLAKLLGQVVEHFKLNEKGNIELKTEPSNHTVNLIKKLAQYAEKDLGPVYGWEWNHFGAKYIGCDMDYSNQGKNQLEGMISTLKRDPDDRKQVVSAWNPVDIPKMGLEPCHYAFHVTIIDGKVNLQWDQRSVDTPYGLPFNIAGYGLITHLIANVLGMQEGVLTGALSDVHIYRNQLGGVEEQLSRDPHRYPLPRVETPKLENIFDWNADMTKLKGYKDNHYDKITFGDINV